jgi:hypothetical protein
VDTVSQENLILEEGKSSELAQCLLVVQETTIDDVDKYAEKTCRELARIIVCRTYAPVILELCHLVVIGAHAGSPSGRYEELFWDSGPARGSAFRAYLMARPTDGSPVFMDGGEAAIGYADKPFAVSYGRMPLLSALLEFLMTALGYTELDEALSPLIGDFPDARLVSDAAKDLSRRLYAYLGEHLPAVQTQKKNRSFLAFAKDRADGALTPQTLNDDLILEYWLAHSADADQQTPDDQNLDVDARTYRGVFETAARLIRTLRFAEERFRMGGALPIGADREAGEVDPADFEAAVSDIDEATPWAQAEEILGGTIKFMNKRELAVLAEPMHGEDVAATLAHSILRSAVFAHAQARLTQAQRGKPKSGEIRALIESLPDENFDTRIDAYKDLNAHLDRMLAASLHVLGIGGHVGAIPIVLEIAPDLDLGELGGGGGTDDDTENDDSGNVVSFQAATAARNFFNALQSDGDSDLAELGRAAAAAFKALSRKGFSPADIAGTAHLSDYADGAKALIAARRELSAFLSTHTANIDWPARFEADKPVFKNQFTLLYGGHDG